MKIRTQNMLAIVPLFLGLAVLIGALMYFVQYRELLWGLDEEATSIAVATARHMDPERVRAAETEEDWQQLMANPVQVLEWQRARRIVLMDPDLSLLFDSADDSDAARTIPLTPALHDRLHEAPYASTAILQDDDGRFLYAFSPVGDDDGMAAIVAVETDADTLGAHELRMRRDIQLIVIVTVLIGMLLAILISGIISRRIVSLTRAADAVAGGQYDQPHETAGVQEINDLSSTFNTMSSVLSEVVSKTRRAVVEAEQFRTDDDLARAFTDTFMPPVHATYHGVAVSAVHVSSHSKGHFFAVAERDDAVMVAVGEVGAKEGLTEPLTASSAAAMLQETWKVMDLKAACESWGRLFDVRATEIITWERNAENLTRGTWDAQTGSFTWDDTKWTDEPIVIHTIHEKVAHRIELYVKTFNRLSPEELTREIVLTLDKDQPGAVVVAGRAGDV